MPELDKKRVREIVKEEITDSKINERLAVIETKLDQKADKADIKHLNFRIDMIKEQMKEDTKTIKGYIIGFTITSIAVVLSALAAMK